MKTLKQALSEINKDLIELVKNRLESSDKTENEKKELVKTLENFESVKKLNTKKS